MMNPLGCDDDVFGIASFKEKILRRCGETSLSTKGRGGCGNGVEVSNDFWTLTVFLTPPTSPNHNGRNQESGSRDQRDGLFVNVNDNLADDDDDVFKPRSTKDLTSMLIRDCMWNGEAAAANKTGSFEKLRPLTKTPPLIDCNLRVAYVDPSEIWPFSLAKEIKAGNKSIQEDTKPNGNDCTADEDVEVDVVGLEGAQKVPAKKDETSAGNKDAKLCVSVKYEHESSPPSLCFNEKPITGVLTPNTSDDEYSCKLRSCIKRRRTSSGEIDEEENDIDQKMRISSSGEESDQDCEVGRATHNVLERKRRNELKQRFQYLRDSIPELTGNDRAPKVAILQKAFSYITFLKAQEKSLMEETLKQKTLNDQRLNRVLELQNRNHHSPVF